MTLPASGTLSFSQVNTELGLTATATNDMNSSTVRALAGKTTSGSTIAFSDFFGKSGFTPPAPLVLQAEDASRSGSGLVVSGQLSGFDSQPTYITGYNGTGYVEDFSGTLPQLTFSPNIQTAGIYNLVFRFFASATQVNSLLINNGPALQPSWPGLGYGVWTEMTISNVSLFAGVNSLVVGKIDGYIYLDQLTINFVSQTASPSPAPTPAPSPTPAPPTSAPAAATTATLQAEDAAITTTINNTVTPPRPGLATYTDTWVGSFTNSFVGWFYENGDKLKFTTPAMSAGTYSAVVRHANYGLQQNDISINDGANVTYEFPDNGGTFMDTTLSFTLSEGVNTITLIKLWGNMAVDQITLTRTGSSSPSPSPSPSPAPSPTPAPPPSGGGTGSYLFGSRVDYPTGYGRGLRPTNRSQAQQDKAVTDQYDSWKAARLLGPVSVVADSRSVYGAVTITNCYYDKNDKSNMSYYSEGQGYAMLIFVIMAGYDANAQTYFDGIFKMGRARPAYNMIRDGMPLAKYLSEWFMNADFSSPGDGYNAADGDMDMTLALIMAHRQWGSNGAINYLQEAKNNISALKQCNFLTTTALNNVGLSVEGLMSVGAGRRYASRTSDYMYDHFRQYAAVSGDAFWTRAITNTQAMVNYVTTNLSPVAKLQPGWLGDITTTPIIAPGLGPNFATTGVSDQIMEPYENRYDFNAIRNPWRWGTHYLMTGDATSRQHTAQMGNFLWTDCGGDPNSIAQFFLMDGTPIEPHQWNIAMLHGMAVAAMMGVNSSDQTWLNSAFNFLDVNIGTGYFDTELQLMSMMVMSGNWWKGV